MPDMEPWIHQLIPQLSHIHLHLFLTPGMGSSKSGEQPHAPAFQTGTPVLMIDHTGLFEFPISWPGSNGPFVVFLMDVGESCILDLVGHRVESVDGSTGSFTTGQHVRAPVIQDVIGRQASVVGLNHGAHFQLLDPSSWFQIARVQQLAFPCSAGHELHVRVFLPNLLITLLI